MFPCLLNIHPCAAEDEQLSGLQVGEMNDQDPNAQMT